MQSGFGESDVLIKTVTVVDTMHISVSHVKITTQVYTFHHIVISQMPLKHIKQFASLSNYENNELEHGHSKHCLLKIQWHKHR